MNNTRQRVVREMPAMPREVLYGAKKKMVEVAYCRVSTEDNNQEDSYEHQISHYTAKITSNPEVEFGGIYADYGLSGTHCETRPDFQRMMADSRAGKIDVIRCKAIQRFGRNTVDVLTAVRELRGLGVAVMFEQQGINTLETTGEVLIAVMAAISEQESRNISENVKFGFREKFRKGEVQVNWARWLGYKRNKDTKELEIIEDEAVIIRRIYREFLAGYSTRSIAGSLTRDGIKTAEWKKPTSERQKLKLQNKEKKWLALTKEEQAKTPLCVWSPSSVLNILTNEKYTGDSLQGKTFKQDVLCKRQVNNGESVRFYNEQTHEGIITRETFQMVQEELARRKGLRGSTKTGSAKFSSKYALSKLIYCGVDGENYRRFAYYEKDGTKVPVWICRLKKVKKDDPRKCKQMWVRESDVFRLYTEIIKEIGLSEEFTQKLIENMETSIDMNVGEKLKEYDAEIDAVSAKIIETMRSSISQEHRQEQLKELIARQDELNENKKKLQEQLSCTNLEIHRIDSIKQAITELKITEEVNEELLRSNIEKIIIKDGTATFTFKCGVQFTKPIKQGK